MSTGDRLHAFDHLKALAIVAVVFTHAGPDSWFAEGNPLVWFATKTWTVFHVPSFLFVSGFLYARPVALAPGVVAARLLRVLLPYLLWSAVAQASGVTGARDAGEMAWQIATGSSVGVYYYVVLVSACILLMLPLSLLGRVGALVLLGLYSAYSIAAVVEPSWMSGDTLFWLMREPFQLFAFGFFLCGWLCALWREEILRFWRSRVFLALVVSSVVTTVGLVLVSGVAGITLGYFDRAVYTFGVIASVVLLTSSIVPNAAIRFLSSATLGIYLSHYLFMLWLRPWVDDWAELPRVAALVAVGLVGSITVCGVGRRVLGPDRAARWLGA